MIPLLTWKPTIMIPLKNICGLLQSNNSSNHKIAVLAAAYDNKQLKTLLSYTYDPFKNYGITWPSWDMDVGDYLSESDIALLDKLSRGELRGNAAFQEVQKAISINKTLSLVLNRDLRCGIAAKTINKVWPKLIPTFEVQLATAKEIAEIKFPCYVEPKYDGVRLIVIVEVDRISIRTRNGNYVSLPRLSKCFEKAEPGIYDGELIYGEGNTDQRTTVSGLVNSAMHGGVISEDNLVFKVFDFLTLAEFNSRKCTRTYEIRRHYLNQLVPNYSYTELSSRWYVKNAEDLSSLYEAIIIAKGEGVIVKSPTSLYKFKRTVDWIKLKEVKTADLICVGVQDGTGKYEGMIGALLCEGNVEGRRVAVKVGSGLSDYDRGRDECLYLDETIEVKYNTVILDSYTNEYSLFLPRFVCVRYDK